MLKGFMTAAGRSIFIPSIYALPPPFADIPSSEASIEISDAIELAIVGVVEPGTEFLATCLRITILWPSARIPTFLFAASIRITSPPPLPTALAMIYQVSLSPNAGHLNTNNYPLVINEWPPPSSSQLPSPNNLGRFLSGVVEPSTDLLATRQ
ncbi:hypothetical protein JAAARDRAFT_203951 [Jaapia argillacea MUCL 33604]|uniref:Uncharacterized protein n=1 Tax=Jaapia argillacea MUCL 33604 TaxID=933084 RepID=A0A067QD89_9AGAM|nr:hypothetical protein JAAARDRAFT_203951 [Jaapia argillacea MUCL 33604]